MRVVLFYSPAGSWVSLDNEMFSRVSLCRSFSAFYVQALNVYLLTANLVANGFDMVGASFPNDDLFNDSDTLADHRPFDGFRNFNGLVGPVHIRDELRIGNGSPQDFGMLFVQRNGRFDRFFDDKAANPGFAVLNQSLGNVQLLFREAKYIRRV